MTIPKRRVCRSNTNGSEPVEYGSSSSPRWRLRWVPIRRPPAATACVMKHRSPSRSASPNTAVTPVRRVADARSTTAASSLADRVLRTAVRVDRPGEREFGEDRERALRLGCLFQQLDVRVEVRGAASPLSHVIARQQRAHVDLSCSVKIACRNLRSRRVQTAAAGSRKKRERGMTTSAPAARAASAASSSTCGP